jgi:hypothetical protein
MFVGLTTNRQADGDCRKLRLAAGRDGIRPSGRATLGLDSLDGQRNRQGIRRVPMPIAGGGPIRRWAEALRRLSTPGNRRLEWQNFPPSFGSSSLCGHRATLLAAQQRGPCTRNRVRLGAQRAASRRTSHVMVAVCELGSLKYSGCFQTKEFSNSWVFRSLNLRHNLLSLQSNLNLLLFWDEFTVSER